MDTDEFKDDPSFGEEHWLLRRVPIVTPDNYLYDQNLGRYRPSSSNFIDIDLSVSDEASLIAEGRQLENLLVSHPKFGFFLAKFKVGLARNLQQIIYRDPTPEDPNHSIVYGKKTKSVSSKLAKNCEWAIGPT